MPWWRGHERLGSLYIPIEQKSVGFTDRGHIHIRDVGQRSVTDWPVYVTDRSPHDL
jgi:hypothetical protein